MSLATLFFNKEELIEVKIIPFRGEEVEAESIKVEKEESA